MPAVRAVRSQAAKDDYRMQTIILGIVQSVPFTMRRTPKHDDHQETDWSPHHAARHRAP